MKCDGYREVKNGTSTTCQQRTESFVAVVESLGKHQHACSDGKAQHCSQSFVNPIAVDGIFNKEAYTQDKDKNTYFSKEIFTDKLFVIHRFLLLFGSLNSYRLRCFGIGGWRLLYGRRLLNHCCRFGCQGLNRLFSLFVYRFCSHRQLLFYRFKSRLYGYFYKWFRRYNLFFHLFIYRCRNRFGSFFGCFRERFCRFFLFFGQPGSLF